MKIENTHQEKAKFAANYFLQNVYHHIHWNEKSKSDVLSIDKLEFISKDRRNDCVLHLRALISITDDEAIEVAKLNGWVDSLSLTELKLRGMNAIESMADDWHCSIPCYQYLQSRGFALPYHNLSVEDLQAYGWIKLT